MRLTAGLGCFGVVGVEPSDSATRVMGASSKQYIRHLRVLLHSFCLNKNYANLRIEFSSGPLGRKRKVRWEGTHCGWKMIGAEREKKRGSEEMLGMPQVCCCLDSSLARSPREVASSRPLSDHARRLSQFASVACSVRV